MRYLLFFLMFILLILFSSSDPFFGRLTSLTQKTTLEKSDFSEIDWVSTTAFDRFISDYDNRVDSRFKVDPFFKNSVRFWFLIYTQFNSSQVVIHDKDNLSIIYGVIDFNSLFNKKISNNTKYILQQEITGENIQKTKDLINRILKDPFKDTTSLKKINFILSQAGISLPKKRTTRIEFLKSLLSNIRSQTGQKNFILDGIKRSIPFENFLFSYFKSKKLPHELLAIPFLESSFNPEAQSKVNALGAWQFMPFIASHFVPKRRDHIDYRRNVPISSVSAAFLLSQNYNILRSWDLAVTAYNSGTKHLLNIKRKLKKMDINLKDVILNSDSKHFGFASKNFYSEFLALVHAMAYRDEVFDFGLATHKDIKNNLHIYVSKCNLKLTSILNESQISDVDLLNHHFYDFKKDFHSGLILTSRLELPLRFFKKLTPKEILKYKPIEWPKITKNQSCSTK